MNPIILDTTKSLASLVNDKTNGLGRLSECTSCIVQEEINGAYTATIQYPVSGKHYEELNVNGLIKLKPNETGNLQIFRINKISKPFNGIVTIYLNHISYDLSKTSVAPFKTTNASATIAAIKSNMTGGDAFSFSSTVTSQGDFENLVYASARSLLGGDSASVLSTYGGEFEWDNLSVKLVPRRGQDRDISLRRGKNLTDLVQTEDISNYYTNLKAYVKDSDNNIVSSDLQTIVSGVSEENRKILNVDLSSDFDLSKETGLPSVADVNAAAQKYIENNNYGDVQISLTVSFIPLWQTNEYERYAPFEIISMGDRINVYYETLSVNANVRMVSYEYDVLNERYNSITLGTVTSTLASTIAGIESGNKNDIAQTENFLQQAINSAKNMLTGAYGGHIVPTFNANKQWNELFAIDTTDPNTATKGLRLNANGLGAFRNGIDGDYVVAITIDGQIVADRITTGTLRAIDIEGVNITGSTITFGTTGKTVTAKSDNGNGILFDGDGAIRFRTRNSAFFENFEQDSQHANLINITAHDGNGDGWNQLELYNYWNDKYANSMEMNATDTATYTYLVNEDHQHLRENSTSFSGYENIMQMKSISSMKSIYIKNAQLNSNAIANTIEAWATPTLEACGLFNYCGNPNVSNSISARRENERYYIYLYNTYKGERVANTLRLSTLQNDGNELWLSNYDYANDSHYASYFLMRSNSSGNTIYIDNFNGEKRVSRILFFNTGSLTLESSKIFDVEVNSTSVINSNPDVDGGAVRLFNGRYYGSGVISADFGAGRHAITLGWDGSRLILYVDNVFIGYVSTTK